MRPLLRVAGQQLLVLQVLLMKNRIYKMLLIPGTVFFAVGFSVMMVLDVALG